MAKETCARTATVMPYMVDILATPKLSRYQRILRMPPPRLFNRKASRAPEGHASVPRSGRHGAVVHKAQALKAVGQSGAERQSNAASLRVYAGLELLLHQLQRLLEVHVQHRLSIDGHQMLPTLDHAAFLCR